MPAAVRRPVLSQSYPNYMPPMAPALDTAPSKKKSKLVPVVINPNTTMAYTVMLDPENNKVVSDGSDISNMMTSNIDSEKETLEAANQQYRQNTVVDPYQEAEQKMKVANDKFNLAQQYELGSSPYLEEYTDASNEAKAILENDIEPNAIDGVLNSSNTYRQAPHALDVFEQDGLDRKQGAEDYLGEDMMASVNAFNATDSAVIPTQGMALEQEMPTGARLDPYMEIPSTKEGFHRMPDGTLMADSEMESDGVLGNNNEPNPKPKAVLDTTSSSDRKGSAVSSNARGSMMPFAKIDRNEALIRIGGAMVGGSSQGYTGAMKAATAEYGNIQDANRVSETAAFNKEEATRLAEERIAALKAKGSGKSSDKDKETFNNVSSQLNSFQSGLDAIAQSKAEGGNLTGVGGIFKSFIDNYTGSPDAARRLLLSRLKVDDALLRVAETKGAISNKEMDLFLQPAPKNFQDEKIWVDWINERMVALRNVQNRLNGNVVINESEQSFRYRAPVSNYKPVEVDGFTIQQTKK